MLFQVVLPWLTFLSSCRGCYRDTQSLDKRVINHAFSGRFTMVNFSFILPRLLSRHTPITFTMVKRKSSVTLQIDVTMVNLTLLW